MTAAPEADDKLQADEIEELRMLGVRAALLASIKAQVDLEAKAAVEQRDEAMRVARKTHGLKSIDVQIPDEYGPEGVSTVATIAYNKDGKPSVIVQNMPACIAYVAERKPEWIKEIVDPMYLGNLLKTLKIQPGGVVTDEHGEVIDWAGVAPAAPGSLAMRFSGGDDGKQKILAAWLGGKLPGVRPLQLLPAPEPERGGG